MKKQNFLTRMLLLLALIVGSVNGAWGQVNIATATFDGKNATYTEGWTTTGTGIGRTDCIIIGSGENITSPSFNLSIYSNVTISFTGRRYGTLTNKKATVKVSISGSQVGNTIDFTSSSVETVSNTISFVPTGSMTAASLVFTCTNATSAGSSHGAGIGSITITGTLASKPNPVITFNDASTNVGKILNLSTLFSSDSSGDVTYTITEGSSYASISGSTLTGSAVGSVTVKASQAEDATHDSGEATATITVNAAKELSSIAITIAPAKITYSEGETFDATGMVVTATYSDESTDDVTAYCSFSPSTALTTSDTEITVSYTENAVTKTATQAIVVNELVDYATLPFVWDGGESAAFKALTGVSTSTLDSDYAVDNAPYYIKFNETGKYIDIKTDCQPGQVAIGIKKVGGANTSTLTIQESADGENFTDVEELYTTGAKDAVVNLNTTNKYDEASRYVRIYFTKEYNNTKGSNIGVGPIKITKTEPIEVTSTGYATYVSDADLDYSGLAVKAYKALVSEKAITFMKVTTVPAGEGVLLQGAGTYNVPVAASAVAAWADSENAFIRGTGVAVDSGSGPYNYILNNGTNGIGFYKANGKTVATNRAYLQSTSNAARLSFSFDDEAGEATGISEVKDVKADAVIYNLNGVRVKNMTKGLYIMNGKKVVLK